MIDTNALRQQFLEQFKSEPRLFRAPGRVNLIGEHTDYNDGFVLPVAIDLGTIVAGAARADRRVRVRSLNLDEALEFDLDNPGPAERGIWLDYVEGVAVMLETRGARLRGADLALTSDIPIGAGLSSSASLEIAVGLALLSLSEQQINRVSLALAAQAAEHNYVGAKVGIMDQYVTALGRAGHALLIDCRSLETTLIALNLPDTAIVICDTRIKHSLASSEYNTRRAECERGVELLSAALPGIRALRDVSIADFEKHQDRLPEPIRRRCRHVVTENARTLAAAAALGKGDLREMRQLMAASHQSLKVDYEVSSPELDLMVELANGIEGVTGARMTGGGFGGCTVNLVELACVEEFKEGVADRYQAATGIAPTIYITQASDGASEIGGHA